MDKTVVFDLPALCTLKALLVNKLNHECSKCEVCDSRLYHRDLLRRALDSINEVLV